MKKEINVAYGTLDLRIKQDLELAEKQIKDICKNNPTEFYFDIIHTANQTPRALAWLPEVTALIKRFSKLSDEFVIVKLNTNDRILRARNQMFKKITEHDITDVQHKVAK